MLNISKLKEIDYKKKIINNELPKMVKYHPSVTKEWFNSVYSYNKTNEKNMLSIDTYITKFIDSYFNMINYKLERKIGIRKKALWKRRSLSRKIFISKPEFKHTNDKVIITLYVYNRELSLLKERFRNIAYKLYAKFFKGIFINKWLTPEKISLARDVTSNFSYLKRHFKYLRATKLNLRKKGNFFTKYKSKLTNLIDLWDNTNFLYTTIKRRGLNDVGNHINIFENRCKKQSKSAYILNIISHFKSKDKFFDNLDKKFTDLYSFSIVRYKSIRRIKRITRKLRHIIRYHKIFIFNNNKFNYYIRPLKTYLEKLYKKNVEFNIVSLKSYHLNSSILTKIIALKLKTRKTRLLNIFNHILTKVKIPMSRKLDYFQVSTANKKLKNIILKQHVYKQYFFKKPNFDLISFKGKDQKNDIKLNNIIFNQSNYDKLDVILKSIYSPDNILNKYNDSVYISNRNIENIVLDSIKNKTISGIRLQASGRLTKRITAARSILKIRQKGTIKNIDSSYKKIPSVLLKGNLRSNIQFTKLSSKSRIGSFGIKGWVSSV